MNTKKARDLRRNMTEAEHHLWQYLRRRQLKGNKFRRQFPLGKYIVDFVCLGNRLIIELDGGQHVEALEYDRNRTRWLEMQGFRVLRFWNDQVLRETDAVLDVIASNFDHPHPNPPPSRGRGQ